MIPWELVARAVVPGDAAELRLMRRGSEFSIMAGTAELMNSRRGGSEEAFATIACDRLRDFASARILIGGLGMGFTLRAALSRLPAKAVVEVAELVPDVADWAKTVLGDVFGTCLADPRVALRIGDVGAIIRANPAAYDAILLDVDNGPEGLTRAANDRLYDGAGLGAARAALRPGGILAVWSARESRAFSARLRQGGFVVDEIGIRGKGGRGARHIVWIATR